MAKTKKPFTKTGIQRIANACIYAARGLKAAFEGEAAFRQETIVAIVAIPVAFLMHVPLAAKMLLIGSIFLILIIECINTAIEALADQISDKKHKLLGVAKDCGSAAVFLAIINAALIWILVIFFRS